MLTDWLHWGYKPQEKFVSMCRKTRPFILKYSVVDPNTLNFYPDPDPK